MTPVLVSSGKPDYWALYIYLAIVTAAAFGLARVRLWRWLAVTTIAFALLWTFPAACGPSLIAPHAFHVIAGFVLAALLVVCGFMFGPPADEGQIEPISSGSLAAYLFGAMMIALAGLHADAAMIAFALLVAGTLFVAWRARGGNGRGRRPRPASSSSCSPNGRSAPIPTCWCCPAARCPASGRPPPTDRFRCISYCGGDLRARLRRAPDSWRRAARTIPSFRSSGRRLPVFTPLALLVALYARIAHLDRSIPFAILAVLLAAAFAAATEHAQQARRPRRACRPQSRCYATGTLAALALALTFALEKGWLTIALALMSLGTAWISLQRPIPFLRTLAAILAGIVVLRIGYEPRIVGSAVGTTPIFNWLLWGYGVPALSFWAGAHFLRRNGDDAPLRAVEAAAILFTVLLVFMEIRHFINNGDVYRQNAGLIEVALQVCAALAMAIGLERLRVRSGSVVHNIGAILLTVFAGAATILGLLLVDMPLFSPINVGGGFINL